jgi:hypothetical protein
MSDSTGDLFTGEGGGTQPVNTADGVMKATFWNGPQKWDVRDGKFHDHRDSFKILSLTKNKFVIQDEAHGHHTGTWTRIAPAE